MQIDCLVPSPFDRADLAAVRRAFSTATPLALGQSWRSQPESDFAPALVRTGWRDETMFVFAELTDADIFTRATDHNQAFWELGDTFEIFLKPADRDPYVELHVAPNNLHLHLRFPSADWLAQTPPQEVFALALREPSAFRSTTWVDAGAHTWSVLAEIPSGLVTGGAGRIEGNRWRFSFSRYDYTRGRDEPVISSTSPHPMPSFHRQEEWGSLLFRRQATGDPG